ncbi:MAG: ParB/RepB/Spo0J family partition protein [Patescibacteria group bacterium]
MPLGKSLGNILDDYFGDQALEMSLNTNSKTQSITTNIPISEVQIGSHQTRSQFDFEKIQSLAQNIKENGLIHPVMVISRPNATPGSKEYILLSGERRLRACKLLGWKEILAIVKPSQSLSNQQQAMISAMENLQREDLSAIELSNTFLMLIKTQNISESRLAEILGHTTQYVKNYLRLQTLGKAVKQALLNRTIGEGQARHLVGLDELAQEAFLEEIISKNLTVKEVIRLLNKPSRKAPLVEIKSKIHNLNSDILNQANRLAEKFPNAKLKCTGDGSKGRILITWSEN